MACGNDDSDLIVGHPGIIRVRICRDGALRTMGIPFRPSESLLVSENLTAPHVVILVDNFIDGDSRVQKTATSMLEKGWRVTLVGRRRNENGRKRDTVGGVRALKVFVKGEAAVAGRVDRPVWYRNPVSYSGPRMATHRVAMRRAAVTRQRYRIDRAKAAGTDRGLSRVRTRVWMKVQNARHRWATHRAEVTTRVMRERALLRGRADRLAMAFWRTTLRNNAWERLDSGIWDWETAFGPAIDRLAPDLIHANDHRMLAIGARAAARAKAQGRDVKLVWDAHELLAGLEVSPNTQDGWMPGQLALEKAHAHEADAVITVSEKLAEMLQEEHGLKELPRVVRNAPIIADIEQPEVGLREVVGLGADVPILLYSGSLSKERSVTTVVQALPMLPGVHFVMVCGSAEHPLVVEALELAQTLGVADRLHLAPYVPIKQIVPYLSGATVGVHPILHGPNNEIALPTKYYEYSQAGLPVVVTDVKVMAETTRRLGIGEVFAAGDAADLARAAAKVFADPDRYRAALTASGVLDSWTWEAQADTLDEVYRELLGRGPAA